MWIKKNETQCPGKDVNAIRTKLAMCIYVRMRFFSKGDEWCEQERESMVKVQLEKMREVSMYATKT